MTKPQIVKALVIVFASIGVGCSPTPTSPQNVAQATQPRLWIDAPLNGAVLPIAPVEVVSHSTDPSGVAQVELSVEGKVIQNDRNQDLAKLLVTMQQSWSPRAPGTFTLMVRAQNQSGAWGEYARTVVTIGSAATPIPLSPSPQPRPPTTPQLTTTYMPTPLPRETQAPRETPAPRPPVLVAPIDGTALECGRENLTWKPATDASGIRDYDVELEKFVEPSFVSEKTWNNLRAVSTPFDPSCGTRYRWRVRATDDAGKQGDWSSYGYFRVRDAVTAPPTATATPQPRDKQAPHPPTQIAPIDGISVDCVQVNLTWKPAADASGIRDYDVELQKLADRTYAAEKTWNNVRGESQSFDPTCDTHYRWRIRATDNAGNQGTWSDYQDFQVRAIIQ